MGGIARNQGLPSHIEERLAEPYLQRPGLRRGASTHLPGPYAPMFGEPLFHLQKGFPFFLGSSAPEAQERLFGDLFFHRVGTVCLFSMPDTPRPRRTSKACTPGIAHLAAAPTAQTTRHERQEHRTHSPENPRSSTAHSSRSSW